MRRVGMTVLFRAALAVDVADDGAKNREVAIALSGDLLAPCEE